MAQNVTIQLMTMCLVQDGDKVLLVNRPPEKGFLGFIGPGGKVDFPESLTNGAAREVYEETGLTVKKLVYKGLDEYTDPGSNYRYMVFNYLATEFEGELLEAPPEGELAWVPVAEAVNLPMQPWFKRRFPLFFEEGTFEIYQNWDGEKEIAIDQSVKRL
ncbi:8-oxo-dGTP diphosphatase [Planococcus shixiaomingii]|uniref:8-oxo-dGTP diphosphatase n=1 Tax=Planococcus shixiaomingii TaxID=3058393 RepID=UPI0026128713|nr:8-oxo-dGTP diphosphatase [Planococcus sp. N022]WKA54651.1 8-oxo-dGTP diphosphatase [Planococcus sp. N022]